MITEQHNTQAGRLRSDWSALAARMRGDLDRADLTGRARGLAEFIIKLTLAKGRTRVVIPDKVELCELVMIGKTHVAEVFAALESSRILSVTASADGWEILVYPDSSRWEVCWKCTKEKQDAYLAKVDRMPGQCQGELLEPAPSLARALAETSAENAAARGDARPTSATSPTTSYQNGNWRAGPVPKMVTPLRVKESKDSKPLNFESLKGAVLAIEGPDERRAMDGCRQILGEATMLNDGGKWRNRWRSNRGKVHRVFAAAVEDMRSRTVRSTGAHTEWLWKEFQ